MHEALSEYSVLFCVSERMLVKIPCPAQTDFLSQSHVSCKMEGLIRIPVVVYIPKRQAQRH
jgi:hypothetical protein